MSTATVPTATWTTPALMTSLARSGWGALDGAPMAGVRRVLHAVVDLTDHRTGAGEMTRGQIGDVAGGMSERWVSKCLHRLEDLGIIRWTRGTIRDGRPTPSAIVIVKRALAAVCRAARGHLAARRRARAEQTGRRIRETLRLVTIPPQKRPARRNPLSIHEELSSTLLPFGGLSTANGEVGEIPTPHVTTQEDVMPTCMHHRDYSTCPDCAAGRERRGRGRQAATGQDPMITDPRPVTAGAEPPRTVCHYCGKTPGWQHAKYADHMFSADVNPAWLAWRAER